MTPLLNGCFACVQIEFYWIFLLLVCRAVIIDTFCCLCASAQLLNCFFADMQTSYYRFMFLLMCTFIFIETFFLLMCKGEIIEKFLCFCAIRVLFSSSIAYVQSLTYVQKDAYWHYLLLGFNSLIIQHFLLLVCKSYFIEHFSCLCAVANLLTLLIACVQAQRYWIFCLLVCSNVLIGGTFCLGARFLLLTLKIAYVQLSSYWFALLLGEIFIKVISLLIYATSPLLRENLAIMQFHYYWRYRLLMCRTFLIDDITCLCAIKPLLKT